MQTEHPLSILQAERVRIAAENNLRRETRRKSVNLRRLFGHIAVLESLEDIQSEKSPSAPPSYSETVSETGLISHPTASLDSEDSAAEPDETPELEEDIDENDESDEDGWSSGNVAVTDDEKDAEHALLIIPSHPPMFIQERRNTTSWTSERSYTLDPVEWAELIWELTGKARNETPVIESVEELSDVED